MRGAAALACNAANANADHARRRALVCARRAADGPSNTSAAVDRSSQILAYLSRMRASRCGCEGREFKSLNEVHPHPSRSTARTPGSEPGNGGSNPSMGATVCLTLPFRRAGAPGSSGGAPQGGGGRSAANSCATNGSIRHPSGSKRDPRPWHAPAEAQAAQQPVRAGSAEPAFVASRCCSGAQARRPAPAGRRKAAAAGRP